MHCHGFPAASLQIFPRVFALGTKKKKYASCTVEMSPLFDYTDKLEPCPEDYNASPFDIMKSKKKPYARYVKPLECGELFVKTRGKEMVFAAGHVSLASPFQFDLT